MCLIIVKKKGVPLNMEELRESMSVAVIRNNDGIGYAVKKANCKTKHNITLSKGYFDRRSAFLDGTAEVLRSIQRQDIQDDDELIVHLRYASMGSSKKEPSLTHPFLVVPEEHGRYLDLLNVKCSYPVFVHNGAFQEFLWTREWGSDSYLMAKHVFNDFDFLKSILSYEDNQSEPLFQWFLGSNKLAFLLPKKDLVLLGDFIETDSFSYSNSYYKYSDGKKHIPYGSTIKENKETA
jgi:predicted glutamine amidotransferase